MLCNRKQRKLNTSHSKVFSLPVCRSLSLIRLFYSPPFPSPFSNVFLCCCPALRMVFKNQLKICLSSRSRPARLCAEEIKIASQPPRSISRRYCKSVTLFQNDFFYFVLKAQKLISRSVFSSEIYLQPRLLLLRSNINLTLKKVYFGTNGAIFRWVDHWMKTLLLCASSFRLE